MIKGILLDLDGTVYWGAQEVQGAGDFVIWLRDMKLKHLFVTNRANRASSVIVDQLKGYGIECDETDILTSAEATAQYIGKGSVYCVGEDDMRETFLEAGLVIDDESPDCVVVSFDRMFTYDKLKKACRLIDGGATFIATNPDKGLRTENGISPGTGAIVAAVEAGCGVKPVIVGKPERLIMEMAVDRLGLSREEVLAVGDNVATDVAAGENAGIRTVLMLTGISSREDAEKGLIKPAWIAENYDELKKIIYKHLL